MRFLKCLALAGPLAATPAAAQPWDCYVILTEDKIVGALPNSSGIRTCKFEYFTASLTRVVGGRAALNFVILGGASSIGACSAHWSSSPWMVKPAIYGCHRRYLDGKVVFETGPAP